MRSLGLSLAALAAFAVLASPAFAGVGLHAGMTLSPDDFLIGLHWKSKPLAENLSLVPSVEAGFGDATMVAGNLDLHYDLQTGGNLAPYLGGGVTLNWFDFDGGSETDFGGSILGGISLSQKYFLETKVGLGDVPDWKIYVGLHMQ
jgi:hypothetical protein